jgi:hypothetical protein
MLTALLENESDSISFKRRLTQDFFTFYNKGVIVCCALLCLLNLFYCTTIGWLAEISFRDKPTIAINCETYHVCCVLYKCNKEFNKLAWG